MAAKSSARHKAHSRNGAVRNIEAARDPEIAAKLARLHHVSDEMPGITRHPARHGFDYRRPDDELVRDIDTLKRIRSLVIPPAWTDVWISPDPNGHLQAVGRDARGRKQYRYHPAGGRYATRRSITSCSTSRGCCRNCAPASKRI